MSKMTKTEWNKAIDKWLERDKEITGKVEVPTPEPKPGGLSCPQAIRVVTEDLIIKYTRGCLGSVDPMYLNPTYGKYTRYGGFIAPPTFLKAVAEPSYYPEHPQFPGMNPYYGGTIYDHSFNKVVRPLDELHIFTKYLGAVEKSRPDKPYRLFTLSCETTYINQRDEVVGKLIGHEIDTITPPGEQEEMTNSIYAGREKYPHYTQKQLDEVYRFYDDEIEGKHRRGAEVRYWEDVAEGEEIPQGLQGPLSLSSSFAYMTGTGFSQGSFAADWAALKLALGLAIKNPDTGDWEDAINWHLDDKLAQQRGLPRALQFGAQGEAALANIIINWMGDDGWLKKLDAQHRGVRLFGDMGCAKGKVVKKYMENGEHLVDMKVWLEMPNLNGMICTQGNATVRLISHKD